MPTKPAEKTFNDWSLKVVEELSSLNAKHESLGRDIENQYRRLAEAIERIDKKIEMLSETIHGNGEPEKGLVLRVDRLIQNEARRAKYIGAALVASIGAFITALAKFVVGH